MKTYVIIALLAVLLGVVVYPLWVPKLDPLTNVIHIALSMKEKFYKMTHHIDDHELHLIGDVRKEFENLPMGFITEMKTVHNINITASAGHEIPLHMYVPHSCVDSCPVVIFLHGGGFVLGSPSVYQPVTTKIADLSGAIVVAVDYRKAPEFKFPAGPNDCIEAARWVHDNIGTLPAAAGLADVSKMAIGGDSAGGNLAAIVTNALAGSGIIKLSLLVYPVVTHGGLIHSFSRSKLQHSDAPILTANKIAWFSRQYFNSLADLVPVTHPLACALCYEDFHSSSGSELTAESFPRIHVMTAEIDPLVEEGRIYRDHMQGLQQRVGAGDKITYKEYMNTVHGFFGIPFFPHGTEAVQDFAMLVKSHFEGH